MYYIKQDIDLNNIITQQEEVGKVKWFSIDEINQLINENKFLPPHIDFYHECLKFLDKQ